MSLLLNPYTSTVASFTLTHVADAESTLSTITIPAAAAVGDLAVLFDDAYTAAGPNPTAVVPTGWTQIATDSLLTVGTYVSSYKVLTSGNPGSSITGMSGGTNMGKVMFVFRPSRAIVSVTAVDWDSEATSGNPSSQTISASGQVSPGVVLGQAYSTNDTPSFSVASPAFDDTVSTGDPLIAGYKVYNSSPANHTIDMSDIQANILAGGYLAVT